MHDLVMAERKDEILRKGVDQPKQYLVMMVAAVHRFTR